MSLFTMEGSSKFDQASITFLGLAEYHEIFKEEPKTNSTSNISENMNIMEEMKQLENNIENLNLRCSEAKAKKSAADLNIIQGKLVQIVDCLKKDLAYLEQMKELLPAALEATQKHDGAIIMSSFPKLVLELVQCLSHAVTSLSLSSSAAASENINWDEVLRKMDESVDGSAISSITKCLELIKSANDLQLV